MTRKYIYFSGEEGDECEAAALDLADDCTNIAVWMIEDRDTGESWMLCAEHKDAAKAKGIAE